MEPKYGVWPELEHPQPSNVLYLRGITLKFLAQNTEFSHHRAEEKMNIHLFQK